LDPRERFTATVERYARYRPDYPDALFEWLAALVGSRRAIDLGSGTGILSRQLAERGWDVIGVEPNGPMRERATAAGGARYVDGSAEATGLAAATADLVIGAQAFHWFDLDRALPEIDRIRRPGGAAVAVWNVRAETGFAAAYEAALLRWSTEYASVPKPGPTLAALRARRPGATTTVLRHGQELDLDGVLGRAWSSSYVVHGVTDRAAFDRALTEAFLAHARGGRVELAYETQALAW
jgi:SAM-dependent methyltransferase